MFHFQRLLCLVNFSYACLNKISNGFPNSNQPTDNVEFHIGQYLYYAVVWDVTSEKVPSNMHKMRRFRSSCAFKNYYAGPSCSKLTMSLVNVLLKL